MDAGFEQMTVEEAKAAFAEKDIAFGEICGPDERVERSSGRKQTSFYSSIKCWKEKNFIWHLLRLSTWTIFPAPGRSWAPKCGEHTVRYPGRMWIFGNGDQGTEAEKCGACGINKQQHLGGIKFAQVLFVYMAEDVFPRLTFCGGADTIKERNSANE